MDRILVISRDTDFLRQVDLSLLRVGLEVKTCRGICEAIVKLAEISPDLVILDVARGDGFKDARRLRGKTFVPIIAIGGYPSKEGWAKVVEVGADLYLDKLVSSQELIARLKAIMRRCENKKDDQDCSTHIAWFTQQARRIRGKGAT